MSQPVALDIKEHCWHDDAPCLIKTKERNYMKVLMKKYVGIVVATMMLVGMLGAGSVTALAASGDSVVYITKTGECYHLDGCSYLRRSKIQTTLQSAVDKGYSPCSKCNPGSIDASSTTVASNTKSVGNKAATAANTVNSAIEALKTYKGNNEEFDAYTYYISNADLQTAIGADGDKLLKHFNDYGSSEGRKAK